jgi:hypothetical protein
MLPIPCAGVLEAVEGRDEALRAPGITDVQITVAPGRRVVPVPEGDRYLGFVFARGRSPDVVEATLRHAQTLLRVRVTPDADASATPSIA